MVRAEKGEGFVLLSHPREERRAQPPYAWKPECPEVPTPGWCPAHLEDTPSPFTLSGRNLPYSLWQASPVLLPMERRLAWDSGESGASRAGEGLQARVMTHAMCALMLSSSQL